MTFKDLKEFDEIYTSEDNSKLLAVKDKKVYELKYPEKMALLLPKGELWYDNETVTDGDYLYWFTGDTLFCAEIYDEEDCIYSLDLVKYGDCFYGFKSDNFLKLDYSRDVIKYIVGNNKYTMSLDCGDTEIDYDKDTKEYRIIHYNSWLEKLDMEV